MKKKLFFVINAILTVLTVLGLIKAVFVGLDIDESYSVALAYRLYNGDRLVIDMWEPHQFSAVFTAVFLIPFMAVAGTCEYVVIFIRIMSVAIHCLMGFFLYKTLTDCYGLNKYAAFLCTLIHVNFLPKWIQSTEFELVMYWSLLAFFLLISRYFLIKKQAILLVAAGIASGLSVLCYPTMAVVCVYLFAGFFVCSDKKIKTLWVVLGTAIVGIVQTAVLLSYMSVKEILHFVPYIFMDESHTENSASVKWAYYGDQFLECILLLSAVFAGAFLVSLFVNLAKKKKPVNADTFVGMFLISETAVCVMSIVGMCFFDKNQFYLQIRYFIPVIAASAIAFMKRKEKLSEEDKVCFFLGILPGVLSFAAVLFITNMDVNSTFAKMFCATIVSIAVLLKKCEKKTMNEIAAVSLLCVLLFCRLISLRVTGCAPVTIRASLTKMDKGAEKGIYCQDSYASVWGFIYDNLRPAVATDKEKSDILFVTAENLGYLYFNSSVPGPSVQGTTVYNEMYLDYYREHPERIPQIVVFDASYEANPMYNYSSQNEIFKNWVRENYQKNEELCSPYYETYVR